MRTVNGRQDSGSATGRRRSFPSSPENIPQSGEYHRPKIPTTRGPGSGHQCRAQRMSWFRNMWDLAATLRRTDPIEISRGVGAAHSRSGASGMCSAPRDSTHRHGSKRPAGRPCRRRDTTGTRLLPSLSHAVPYGASRPFSALPDSFVNHLALAPASTIPRPRALSSTSITRSQRYYDPIRHPRGPVLRLTAPLAGWGLHPLRLCTFVRRT